MHTEACICYMHQCVPVPSEEMSGVLELELQAIMSCPVWVLDLNLDPLQKEQVRFLTAEPSLGPPQMTFQITLYSYVPFLLLRGIFRIGIELSQINSLRALKCARQQRSLTCLFPDSRGTAVGPVYITDS